MAIVEEKQVQKRRIGYCRVSTDEQDITNQVIELKKHGIASKDIYRDDGISGTVAPKSRKGFKKVYDLIINGEVSELHIFEISRLGRHISESLSLFIEIEQTGTKILSMSPNEAWTLTQVDAQRIFMAALFAWFADIERKQLSERTKLGIKRARAEGKQIGRPFNKTLNKEVTRKDYEKQKAIGKKPAQIARSLRIPQSTFYRYVAKWEEENRINQNESVV